MQSGRDPCWQKDTDGILDLQTAAVVRRLADDVITSHPITDSMGRQQIATFVSEDGLYDVILSMPVILSIDSHLNYTLDSADQADRLISHLISLTNKL